MNITDFIIEKSRDPAVGWTKHLLYEHILKKFQLPESFDLNKHILFAQDKLRREKKLKQVNKILTENDRKNKVKLENMNKNYYNNSGNNQEADNQNLSEEEKFSSESDSSNDENSKEYMFCQN